MIAAILSVSRVLLYIVPQVATLAKCSQVAKVVIVVVVIEVGNGENNFCKAQCFDVAGIGAPTRVTQHFALGRSE